VSTKRLASNSVVRVFNDIKPPCDIDGKCGRDTLHARSEADLETVAVGDRGKLNVADPSRRQNLLDRRDA
jgi:hypothetical protein